jgi:hypothetical protein
VVEQRIGRIDRIGQEAKRLVILNFVVEDSVEERVLQRLLTKIEIFKESIGDPDPIIGEKIERLAGRALQGDLSPEELDRLVVVRDREFREDLYYRLNVFPVHLPPLRERKADIPELVEHFVQQFADSMGKTIETIPEETRRALVRHRWPGNIRELQNYIERGVILFKDGIFEPGPLDASEPPKAEIVNPTLQEKVRGEIIAACESAKWRLGGPEGEPPRSA